MSLALVIAGVVLAATSGLPSVALRRSPGVAQRAACAALVAAAALGIAGAVLANRLKMFRTEFQRHVVRLIHLAIVSLNH